MNFAKCRGEQPAGGCLSEKISGATTPSDGPSMAVMARSNVFTGKGTWGLGTGEKVYSYSYRIPNSPRFPQAFSQISATRRGAGGDRFLLWNAPDAPV